MLEISAALPAEGPNALAARKALRERFGDLVKEQVKVENFYAGILTGLNPTAVIPVYDIRAVLPIAADRERKLTTFDT